MMYKYGQCSDETCLFLHDTDPFDLGYIDAANFYQTGYKRILSTYGQLVRKEES